MRVLAGGCRLRVMLPLLLPALLPLACSPGAGGVGVVQEGAATRPEDGRGAGERAGDAAIRVARLQTPAPVPVPAGSYAPLYGAAGARQSVAGFELDPVPATAGEYLRFVLENPQWRRGEAPPVFADPGYLYSWRGALDPGEDAELERPVTHVSWFAARSYCASRGMRLPYVHEWEYVAALAQAALADDPTSARRRVLDLQLGRAGVRPAAVGRGPEGPAGVRDLHGGVAEWVEDFQSSAVSDDSRSLGGRDRELYCASGASGAASTDDYAAFLRYALRASLQGKSTLGSLGFRCARSMES